MEKTSSDTYRTPGEQSQGVYKEKGSKFIAHLYPITSLEEVKPLVDALKKQYYDARHHCWAYRLGQDGQVYRAVDDGEPSGTAGRPILGAMTSRGVSGALCVVVRYFGGTKLGTSGLIVAYRDATLDAIDNAQIIEKQVLDRIELSFEYSTMNAVMKLLKNTQHQLIEQHLENNCRITVEIRKNLSQEFVVAAQKIEGLFIQLA